jgi:response regulator of citrate/malate metabolism
MPSKFQEMLKVQRENEETARAGLKWEQEELDQLMAMVADKVSTVDIAKSLQRTEGSIRTRLILNGITKMESDNITMEEASEYINIPVADIKEYLDKKSLRDERRQKKAASPKTPNNVTNADIYNLLMNISKKMDSVKCA